VNWLFRSRARLAIVSKAEPSAHTHKEKQMAGRGSIDVPPKRVEGTMTLNVHAGANYGKIILWTAGLVAFVAIALTKVPEWISPKSASVTGDTGATSRMID
jgi:hypothetical protein